MATLTQTEKVYAIPRRDIEPDPNQPRTEFTAADINELATSLENDSQLEPVVVRKHPEKTGKWMLVNGERRWRAAEKAGMKTLDARIETEDLTATDLLIIQAQYNKQKPLTPLEEARLCLTLSEEPHNLKQTEIAERLSIPRSTVGDRIRMASLPKPWLKLIENGTLTPSHAAIIQPWTAIPQKYHADIARVAMARSEVNHDVEYEKRPPSLQALDGAIDSAVDELKLIRPLGGTGGAFNPKLYEGPILEREGFYRGHKATRFAADPEIWTPLLNAARKERAKKREKERAKGEPTTAQKSASERALIKVPETVTVKKHSGYTHEVTQSHIDKRFGHVFYVTGPAVRRGDDAKGWKIDASSHHPRGGLRDAFDPETLMRTLDYEHVTLYDAVTPGRGLGERFAFLSTTQKGAIDTARQAAHAAWAAKETELLADLGKRLRAKMAKDDKYNLAGSGTAELVKQLLALGGDDDTLVWAFYWMGRAMGIEMPPLRADQYGYLSSSPIKNALSQLNHLDASQILGAFLAYDQKEDPEKWVDKHLTAFLNELKTAKLEWPNAVDTLGEATTDIPVAKETTRTEKTRTTTRAVKRDKRATAGAELAPPRSPYAGHPWDDKEGED